MTKKFIQLQAIALALPLLVGATAAEGVTAPISGVWVTETTSQITIKPCKTGHCGYITKVVVPPRLYKKNKKEIEELGLANIYDKLNKNPELRSRRIQGLQILTLGSPEEGAKYRGKVYSPEDGNTYNGVIEVLDRNKIRLTGCGFFDMICKSEDWVRVSRK